MKLYDVFVLLVRGDRFWEWVGQVKARNDEEAQVMAECHWGESYPAGVGVALHVE